MSPYVVFVHYELTAPDIQVALNGALTLAWHLDAFLITL